MSFNAVERLGFSHYLMRQLLCAVSLCFCAKFEIGVDVIAQESSAMTDIKLDATAQEDPRLKFQFPPSGSADSLEFRPEGILVKQLAEAGTKAQHSGFSVLAPSKGHFLFLLDFECQNLVPPKTGWGQGILIRFVPVDNQSPTMAVGYVATRKYKNALCYTPNHTDTRKQTYVFQPESFTQGQLLIERKDQELFISIDESRVGSFRLLKRIACTTAPIHEVQVWCTRQESGNSTAQYLLKRVQWIGDEYFSQPPPPPPFWTWGMVKAILFWSAMLAGIAYVVQGVRSGKIPLYRT